jgi:hypothetical protein
MSTCIGLYDYGIRDGEHGFVRQGEILFHNLLLGSLADFTCTPAKLLTPKEIEQVCCQLRRLPQINGGKVGNCIWREERPNQVETPELPLAASASSP